MPVAQRQTLVLGGPGAGKTTRLLKVMEEALARGVRPDQVAFVTFTRAAAQEAIARAQERFGFSDKEMPYFRTLHSLCFRELGLKRADVVGDEHLRELGELTGELVTGQLSFDGPAAKRAADALLTIDHYARTTRLTLRRAWDDHGGDVDWYRLKRFCDAYRLYKEDRVLLDFTDMLEAYVSSDLPAAPVRVAIVDEGQDLTLLQWAVVARAFQNAEELWVAGDDDQQIHEWAGAAEDHFLHLPFAREVLPLSHRLPEVVFQFAAQLIQQVRQRYVKAWSSSGRTGEMTWLSQPDEVDLSRGTWLLLARTRAQMEQLARVAREQGVVYRMKGESSVAEDHVRAIRAYEDLRAGKRVEGGDVLRAFELAGVKMAQVDETQSYTAAELKFDALPIWHDALIRLPVETREYYVACLRRGEKLLSPRVRVETIHGSKGAEAERVLLLTDLTYQTHRGYELKPDAEHRTFYVGATRAIEGLFLVAPQTAYGYPI